MFKLFFSIESMPKRPGPHGYYTDPRFYSVFFVRHVDFSHEHDVVEQMRFYQKFERMACQVIRGVVLVQSSCSYVLSSNPSSSKIDLSKLLISNAQINSVPNSGFFYQAVSNYINNNTMCV